MYPMFLLILANLPLDIYALCTYNMNILTQGCVE